MKASRWITLLAICFLAPAPAAAAAAKTDRVYLLTGNDKALWIIRLNDADATFDVVAKPVNEQWKWIAEGMTKRPTALAVIDSRLYALLPQGQGPIVFDLHDGQPSPGSDFQNPLWPKGAAPLTACTADGFGGSQVRSIIAVVAGDPAASDARNRHSAATSSRPAATSPDRPVPPLRLLVFGNASGRWEHVTEYEHDVALSDDTRVLVAVVKGELFLLIRDGAGRPNRLAAFKDGRWRTPELVEPLVGEPVVMTQISSRLVVVLSAPTEEAAQQAVRIASLDQDTHRFTIQPILLEDKPLLRPASELLLATSFAGRLAMIWTEGEHLRFGTCGLEGRIALTEPLTVFARPSVDRKGERVFEYFLWGVLIAILIPMFLVRPRSTPKPFSLPEGVRAGQLYRRLLAGIVDFFPFSILASLLFSVPDLTFDEWWELVRRNEVPQNAYYAMVAMLVLYVGYCIVTESKSGATLGKRLLKLKVIGDEGRPPQFRQVVLRNLVKIIELAPPLVPLLLLFPLFNRNRQRLGDMFARTAVVDAASLSAVPPPDQAHESPFDDSTEDR